MRFTLLVATLLLVVPAVPAMAVVPSTMSHQGVLTDNLGHIVPDGNYTLSFRIYDISVGGVALYLETHPAVPVQLGGYSVVIGSISPLALPFDVPYWLGVQVGADPELTPRIPLTASPYGLSLRLPFSGTASSAGPSLELGNTGSGPDIVAREELEVGTASSTGTVRLFNSTASPVIRMFSSGAGGRIEGFHNTGDHAWEIEEDANGGGGWLQINRAAGTAGFRVDGNFGSNEPLVSILGATRSAVFNMTGAGNASVSLPGDAISATEILDEPGIASNQAGSVGLTSTTTSILSRSITVPTSGYLVAIASSDIAITHVTGTTSFSTLGLSTTAGNFPGNQDFDYQIPSGAASGTYDTEVSPLSVIPVAAGTHTVHLNGRAIGAGSSTAWDLNLAIMFFPTAYGTVTEPQLAVGEATGADEQRFAVPGRAPSATDMDAERHEAEAFNQARLLKELQAMQVQMDALRHQIEQAGNEQTSASNRR